MPWVVNIALQALDADGTPSEVYTLQRSEAELQGAWARATEIVGKRFKLEGGKK